MKIKEKVMSQVLLGPVNPNTQKYALIRIAIEKTLEGVSEVIDKLPCVREERDEKVGDWITKEELKKELLK